MYDIQTQHVCPNFAAVNQSTTTKYEKEGANAVFRFAVINSKCSRFYG